MSKVRNLFFAAAVSLVLAFPSRAKADDLAFMVTSSGQFGVIDLNTGAFSLRSNLSIIAIGLGETPDGKLYTSDSNGVVYQVNPTNGSLTTVGSNGVANFGIGSTTSGLYAVDNLLNLYSINPGTGAAAKIGATGLPQPQGLTTMGLSAGAATLYITYGPSFGPATLYSVNTATGAATAIGNTGVDGIAAVVFENGTLYAGSNWQGNTQADTVNALNVANGTGTLVANVSGGAGKFYGLAPLTRQILPQFAFGGGWYSALYFTNTSAGAVSFTVNFTSDDGTPLVVPSIGSSTSVNLAPQATAILEAPNVGALSEGYVTASLPGGVTGYGVFRQSVPGVPDQEAVVPLSNASLTGSTLTWDDTAYTTAVAIVNPSPVPATVSITVRNSSGSVIGTSSISLAAGAKTEAALRSIQGLNAVVGNRGSAQFTATSGSVAILGLRFNGTAFTSIPAALQ